MNYRILVVDIDGTLVGEDTSISAEDREALAKARNAGVLVSLSTGRAAGECRGIIKRLSLDGYHIFFDGASISNLSQGDEFYVRPIDREMVRQVVEFAHQHEIDLELYSTTQYFAERETWSTEAHRKFFDIEPVMVDFTGLWERERIVKGGLVTVAPQEAAKARRLCRQFGDRLICSLSGTPAYPGVVFVNVLALDVSKGKALAALASHLGVSMSEVMAIGDGTNDITLLSAAGLAIAMGNAPDEVKAVADHVTLDFAHSGVAAAIEKFLL